MHVSISFTSYRPARDQTASLVNCKLLRASSGKPEGCLEKSTQTRILLNEH
ncbi:unnamed protein product [Brassica rapa]|uniref:Uncharacterized protein n=2 Tax=Brassica TaxID=3705 RepID=A0A3P5ZSL1_BRACM|nr:unnamed protein product [Brassica napus]CAG7880155.1 unnamed protein product [Brassica rapa]CDY47079.1 BnaA03g12190D [Brassica napus]VDC79585.1 unnamed protein product [Brassica rapa]